jgi:hypothetical protein
MRSRRGTLLVALLALSLAQESEPAADFDALAERVASLAGFRAEYVLHTSNGRSRRVEVEYLAETRAHVRVTEGGEPPSEMWVVDRVLTAAAVEAGEPFVFAFDAGAFLDGFAPVFGSLDRHLPGKQAMLFEPGVMLDLSLDVEMKRTNLNLGLTTSKGELLGWIARLRDAQPLDAALPELFVFEEEDGRYEVSARHGFIERAYVGLGDSRRLAVELAALELDPDLEAEDFDAPSPTGMDPQQGCRSVCTFTPRRDARRGSTARRHPSDRRGRARGD